MKKPYTVTELAKGKWIIRYPEFPSKSDEFGSWISLEFFLENLVAKRIKQFESA